MTRFFAECLYCGHESHSATEAEHHACKQNTLTEKIDTLEYLRADAVRRFNKAQDQNAALLAALKIALPYVESFDDDNADLQTKANAEAVRAAIAKAKGESS